jgi:hypothetical protein
MITLLRALVAVIVGFFRLFRRVTQAIVVVPLSTDELTAAAVDPDASEKPSTDRKTSALPLCPEPPSQPPRRRATASSVTVASARAEC